MVCCQGRGGWDGMVSDGWFGMGYAIGYDVAAALKIVPCSMDTTFTTLNSALFLAKVYPEHTACCQGG